MSIGVGTTFSRWSSGRFFQGVAKRFFQRGATVVKFHFTNSKLRAFFFLNIFFLLKS